MNDLIFIVDEETYDDFSNKEIITTLITDGEEIEIENASKKGKTFIASKNKSEVEIEQKEKKFLNYQTAGIAMAVAARLLPLPVAVLVNAAPAAYSLYQLLSKKDDKDVPVDTLKHSALAFDKYMKRISMTPEIARNKDYRFQPGHPQINLAYIKHPLSQEKENYYILSDKLDEVLLQERETEMIKVFVSLGATKIEIRKQAEARASDHLQAKVEAGLPGRAGEVEIKMASTSSDAGTNKHVITLAGREWKKGMTLETEQFNWLKFEPTWEAIVYAREMGGCLSAELELKKKSVFSSNNEGRLGLRANMFKGSVDAGLDLSKEQDETYSVYVEFNQPV
ncbi:hypothetical protein [Leclercia adecarboxylata]|uniref:hypothetical protein n=1 Tax=Leclercia adecarboxylata TaxID=83655 RepID=UPI00244A5F3B|nr:hypothetical protein [Leclercia adecarboxylata]MDH0061039.1 hypothetical protein [Leclercia adecarboxylata]